MFRRRILCLLAAVMVSVPIASVQARGNRSSALVKRLSGRNESVRLAALQEVQRDVHTKYAALPELCQAARLVEKQLAAEDEPSIATVALIAAVGSIDRPAAVELLEELLESKNSRVVIIAVDLLGERKHHQAIDALARLRDHDFFSKSYGFRFNLMRSLARMKHPDAIEVLSRWQPQLDGQLRFELDRLLSEVTLEDFGGDQARFAKWKKQPDPSSTEVTDTVSSPADDTEPTDTEPADTEPAKKTPGLKLVSASQSANSQSAFRLSKKTQFYGIDINAKRVMFVIDHSGSMKQYWRGLTRLERAKTELIRVINRLPPDHSFAITFYATKVRLWRDELLKASEANKREAIQFVKSLGYGDQTNTHGALRAAIEFDQELEAVYLLSDGVPTIGDVVAPPSIVRDIMHRNRFRHLQFNTIGVAVSGDTELFLKKLANLSGAEFRPAN